MRNDSCNSHRRHCAHATRQMLRPSLPSPPPPLPPPLSPLPPPPPLLPPPPLPPPPPPLPPPPSPLRPPPQRPESAAGPQESSSSSAASSLRLEADEVLSEEVKQIRADWLWTQDQVRRGNCPLITFAQWWRALPIIDQRLFDSHLTVDECDEIRREEEAQAAQAPQVGRRFRPNLQKKYMKVSSLFNWHCKPRGACTKVICLR